MEDIYFHPRDDKGQIAAPAPRTDDQLARLLHLRALAPLLKMDADRVAELDRRIEAARNGEPRS